MIPESARLPNEPHPGIPGWLPPYHVKHAAIPLSMRPPYVQGVPRRWFTRGGARPALSILSSTPPVFAYLLAHVRQSPKSGPAARVLVAQTQAPLGIYH
jgi:hypothetical protein